MTKKRVVETQRFSGNPFLGTRQAKWFDDCLNSIPLHELARWESADIDMFLMERYLQWHSKDSLYTAQQRMDQIDLEYYRRQVQQIIMGLRL